MPHPPHTTAMTATAGMTVVSGLRITAGSASAAAAYAVSAYRTPAELMISLFAYAYESPALATSTAHAARGTGSR